MKTLLFAIDIALSYTLPLLVQLWDRRRLSDEQKAYVWGYASWGAAIYAWSILSVAAWFWVTRRSVWGVLWGLVALAGVVAAYTALHLAAALSLGLDEGLF